MDYSIVEYEVNGRKIAKVKFECSNCGIELLKPKKYLKKELTHLCCSRKCSDEYRKKVNYDKFSNQVGMDFKEWLKDCYENKKLSAREISCLLYGTSKNSPNILQWMKKLDIKPRDRSTSVSNQFLKPGRRELSAQIAVKHLQTKESRDKLRKVMQTKDYKQKQSLSKQGSKNGMYNVLGSDNPNWNPDYDSSKNFELRKDFKTARWRKAVMNRDGYTCQICNKNTRDLNAHHLDGWNWCEEKRYNLDNGVTLCKKCHHDFHKNFGYGDNTKVQYLEFLEIKKRS